MQLSVPIEKLMYWQAGKWVRCEKKTTNLLLRIIHDQLLITSENSVIETLNMRSKLKGIYKDDILILIVCSVQNEVRKIKFQLKNYVEQSMQKLGEHFPMVSHSGGKNTPAITLRYRNLDEVIKRAVETMEGGATQPLPPSYGSFVKLCLLDPTFPIFVQETEKILRNMAKK